MDFGKVAASELGHVDHHLPADAPGTASVLAGAVGSGQVRYYVGCAKWGREEWKGLIYPEDTKAANFLDAYAKQFNAIELNASFYKVPTEAAVENWRKKVEASAPKGFTFVPKFPRSISHIRKLKNAEEMTQRLIDSIAGLGAHLGPCFLQLSDSFAPKDFDVLRAYLESLPKDLKVFVELRNAGWFDDSAVRSAVFEFFTAMNMGCVITDTSGRRDLLHMELTRPEAFIRFEGNGKAMLESDGKRIAEWVRRIKQWKEQGLQKVYFFLHQEDEADTPALAALAVEEMNKDLQAGLSPIQFISKG
jgi:uncharacterized protein YecE (DUF72 family)